MREAYLALGPIPCTDCKYCLPCPNGVEIPRIFELYNESKMYGDPGGPRWAYANIINEAQRANACIECGNCEEQCPQGIEIFEWLQTAHELLSADGR